MSKHVALITNVLDFVGLPAVQALLEDGFIVIAHDLAFQDRDARDAFEMRHPGSAAVYFKKPNDLIEYAWNYSDKIDVLISNDTFPAIHGPIDKADIEDLIATIDHVMIYPFRFMQAAIPKLKQQGHGNVILITSCRTELPLPGGAIPDMARAGANTLVKSLSLELAPHGIPVNAIAPNYLYSEAYFPKAKFIDNPIG